MTKLVRSILNKLTRLYQKVLRSAITTNQLTIISNNCWAGRIYEDLKLPYQSPTIGLFFYAPCYIKFISDLKVYLKLELKFTNESKYPEANKYRLINQHFYPIGILDNIEIHFLHYLSISEAKLKWDRRKIRVNFNNIFFKMCDRDLCTENIIRQFDNLPYRKVFFSAKKYKQFNSLIYLPEFKGQQSVGDLYTNQWSYRRKFNIVAFITGSNKYAFLLKLLGIFGYMLSTLYKKRYAQKLDTCEIKDYNLNFLNKKPINYFL
jgi:uncharacterized protein (DUF1919 family)